MQNKIFIVIGLILLCVLGPMAIRPTAHRMRPVLDEKGQQVYRADGKPKFEGDAIGEFKRNWDGYAIMSAGGICILFGASRGLRDFIRNRQRSNK